MANGTRPFTFWFNSTSKLSINPAGQTHMKKVEALVADLAAKSNGRLTNRFIKDSSIRIQ
jgi:hypothetical protein